MSPRPDLGMSRDQVAELLERRLIGVVSTIGRDGYPHSVGIYYAPFPDHVSMWVYGKSQKVRNAEREPRACLVVEDGQPYIDLRGVMIRGRIHVVRDQEAVYEVGRVVYDRYFAAAAGHPFEQATEDELRRRSQKRVVLELPLEKVVSWDHAKASL